MDSATARVFVSSTSEDLLPERRAVELAIHRMRALDFVGMEYFGSRSEHPLPASLDEVDRSQVYVGIFGGRYGSGITAAEYRRAVERNLRCFIYFKAEATLAEAERERDGAKRLLRAALHAELRGRHTSSDFSNPDQLATFVAADLHRWLFDEHLAPRLDAVARGAADPDEAREWIAGIKDTSALDAALAKRLQDGGFLRHCTAQPTLALALFPVVQSTRFFYGARRVPFLGRKAELEALETFLAARGPVSWWLLCGPGGVGKNRLALEACLRNAESWRAGWLEDPARFDAWDRWQPDAPTLMIIDNVATHAEATRDMLVALHRRSAELAHPVRVLLLERRADGPWRDRFSGTGAARHSVDATCHDQPLQLAGLDTEGPAQIMGSVVRGWDQRDDRQELLGELDRMDPLRRPLFAAFAADAIDAGRDIRSWDPSELLGSILKREQQEQWAPAGVTAEELNLLGLVTLVGGLPLETLKRPPVAGLLPEPRAYSPDRYRLLSGRAAESFLAPLDPAVLGELFVLEHFQPTSALDERAGLVRDAAVCIEASRIQDSAGARGTLKDALPESFADFIERAAHDFPGHPTLRSLRRPRPAPDAPHFTWGIETANLIETLEEEANLELCYDLYLDLYTTAFEEDRQQVSLLRMRTADAALDLLLRYFNRRDADRTQDLYGDLDEMRDRESGLEARWLAGAAMLALGHARRREPVEAERLYDEVRSFAAGHAEEMWAARVLVKTSAGLVSAYAGTGELEAARSRYGDFRALAACCVARNAFHVEQGRALESLVGGYGSAGELAQARGSYAELSALRAIYPPTSPTASGITGSPPGCLSPNSLVIGFGLGLLSVALKGLAGRQFKLTPEAEPEPRAELGACQARAAQVLIGAYGSAHDPNAAATIQDELRGLAREHPTADVLRLQGQGAWSLLYAWMHAGRLSEARTAYDELSDLASVHGDDVVPLLVLASSAYHLLGMLAQEDRESARAFAAASQPFLCQETTRAALVEHFGQDGANWFYGLLRTLVEGV